MKLAIEEIQRKGVEMALELRRQGKAYLLDDRAPWHPDFKKETNMDGGVAAEMPRYRSHKEVWALKIESIETESDRYKVPEGGALIIAEGNVYAPFGVDAAYMQKHKPQVGGYYVRYADGYESWSPAQAFEEGYTRVN